MVNLFKAAFCFFLLFLTCSTQGEKSIHQRIVLTPPAAEVTNAFLSWPLPDLSRPLSQPQFAGICYYEQL